VKDPALGGREARSESLSGLGSVQGRYGDVDMMGVLDWCVWVGLGFGWSDLHGVSLELCTARSGLFLIQCGFTCT
jgi:hypothetical protein